MSKYYWPMLRQDIEVYVKGCDTCQKVKAKNSSTTTPLHPNEVPSSPWEIISVDLIGPLPQSEGKNAILVIVDWFSKIIHLFPVMDTITSKAVATIFHNSIFKLNGTPRKIISDRGLQFVSLFMKDLYELLNIQANPSTAYHPQTDEQTEQINHEVEKYLRIYVNHRQTNWAEWLALAEFAHNSQTTSATSISPVLLNYGQQPIIPNKQVEVWNESASMFISKMKSHHQAAHQALEKTTKIMKKAHDKYARSPIQFFIRQEVLLEGTHIRMDWATKKFDDKHYRPFKIIRKVGESAYELALPSTWWGIHPVFNESLLTSYHQGIFPSQEKPTPPQYHWTGRKAWDRRNLEYLIHWCGYPHKERKWKKMSELKHAQDAIKKFHCKNPNAPRLTIKLKLCSLFDFPDFLKYQKWFNCLPNEMFKIPMSSEPCLTGILVDQEFNS